MNPINIFKRLIKKFLEGKKHEVNIENLNIYIVRFRVTNNTKHFDFKIKS